MRTLKTVLAIAALGLVATTAFAGTPSTTMPQGLTGGMTYTRSGTDVLTGGTKVNHVVALTVRYGTVTFACEIPNPNCTAANPLYQAGSAVDQNGFPCGADIPSTCSETERILGASPGWFVANDGDRGLHSGYGFYNQELLAGVSTGASDNFNLPTGTACGFHHTLNDPAVPNGEHTCMHHDPAVSCPVGWRQRKHFDMSSGNGLFVWCEYENPHQNCTTAACINEQVSMLGVTVGVESDTDATGSTLAHTCPAGSTRTPFFDDGRGSGQGLSWCRGN